MTKREAAIVTAYTGILLGDFAVFQRYAEEKLGRPVMTHELAISRVWNELKDASRADFEAISVADHNEQGAA